MENEERIKELIEATKQIKAGNLPLRLHPISNKDEIDKLSESIVDLSCFLEKRFLELREISKITQKINAGMVLDDVLSYAYDAFKSLIPYDRISFSFIEENGTVVRARWARSEAPVLKIKRGFSAPLAGSSLGQILLTGKPRILNNLEEYLKLHPHSESTHLIVQEGIRSSLTCPLIALNKPIGFMFFSSMKPNTYKDLHADTFLKIAAEFSIIAEKSRLYEHLLELNETKNQLLGMAAHDLRNPLAFLLEASRLLLDGDMGALNEEQSRFIKIIHETSDFALGVVHNCLDVSQIESGKLSLELKEEDLVSLIQKNVEMNRAFAKKKNIEIKTVFPSGPVRLVLDAKRIEQVLNNLLSNGIKYSFPNTEITLEVCLKEKEKEVLVLVRDQGQGIAAHEMKKLFLPFSTTSTTATAGEKSTGLGLVIAKRFIEGHQGKIKAESVQGQGSTFSFTLSRALSETL